MRTIPPSVVLFLAGMIQFLLYGAYAILFAICIVSLKKARDENHANGSRLIKRTQIMIMTLLFILASLGLAFSTTQICLQLFLLQPDFITDTNEMNLIRYRIGIFNTLVYILELLANVIIEMILIYRCYLLWNFRFSIVVAPIILSLTETALILASLILVSKWQFHDQEYIFSFSSPESQPATNLLISFFVVCMVTNIILTSLIGGRIWQLSRGARRFLGEEFTQKYRRIIAIIAESGALYPAFLIIYLALILKKQGIGAQILFPSTIQVMCIAPTLIIVRVGLGISVEIRENSINSSLPGEHRLQFLASPHGHEVTSLDENHLARTASTKQSNPIETLYESQDVVDTASRSVKSADFHSIGSKA
ncbi:hypothetical protein VKT23_007763 [Stygiomarasmius scandens]|uniref:G protein-coupled receptor n=1 Tax=Marasmiellus scandens TaxID=2682957 RepID=A0ABR1JJ89_9AGAR